MQATRLPQKRVIQPKGASGSKSLHRKNTLSAPWQMNFRNPSKSPQHPNLTKTSRCGGVAPSVLNIRGTDRQGTFDYRFIFKEISYPWGVRSWGYKGLLRLKDQENRRTAGHASRPVDGSSVAPTRCLRRPWLCKPKDLMQPHPHQYFAICIGVV